MTDDTKQDVFTRVTNTIIAHLEKGVRPWQPTWDNNSNIAINRKMPLRHTGEQYRGVNVLMLWAASMEKGFRNPTFMTFQQGKEYGGSVRKGEKAALVVYANSITKTETDKVSGEDIEKQIPFMKGYSVFNVEQFDNLPEKFSYTPPLPQTVPDKIRRLENVDAFIKHTGADIRYGGNRAFYTPTQDFVQSPPIDAFHNTESFYGTVLHELGHWTRHETRLNRDFGRTKWGDEGYAKEELVAEITAAMACVELGITPEVREDHAAYIESWLRALHDDKKLIFTAASHASKALDFMKALQPVPEAAVSFNHAPSPLPKSRSLVLTF